MMMQTEISTHTPLTGRDLPELIYIKVGFQFLLTRPLRDVTNVSHPSSAHPKFLLTRPLRDVTDQAI